MLENDERITFLSERTRLLKEQIANKAKQISLPGKLNIRDDADRVIVEFDSSTVCTVLASENICELQGFSSDWCNETTYLCEINSDGLWSYSVDSIDECVGEVVRMIRHTALNKPVAHNGLFYEQVKKYGLENPNIWRTDFRSQLIDAFSPLFVDSGYKAEINLRAKKATLDIKSNSEMRVLGVEPQPRKREFLAFFDHQLFLSIKESAGLPECERSKSSGSQDHVHIDLKTLWNAICCITNKRDYFA